MNTIKNYFLFISFISLTFFTSCNKKKNSDMLILSPEEVIDISVAQKAKATITGERKNIPIGNKKNDVWTLLYTDNNGSIHSTIIKKLEGNKNKIGDTLIIYYDSRNPASLPIYEEQYIKLKP